MNFKVGQRVKAFHPKMFGVVKEGEIVRVTRKKTVHIDFGSLNGGIQVVPNEHVVEVIS